MNKKEFFTTAKTGLVNGIFWAIGASLGFAIVSTLLIAILSNFITIPVIGDFVADIVEQAQYSLERR